MKRDFSKKIISAVVAFGACVMLSAAILALTVGAVFSRPYFSLLTGNGYKAKVTGEVLSQLEGLAIPGGLPHDFFEQELDKALLKKDIDRAVSAAFADKSVTFEAFSAATKQSVMRYAQENNITVQAGDETAEENIDHLVSLCAKKYKTLVNSEFIKFGGAISRFLNPWCLIIAVVLGAIAAGLIIATHKIGGITYLRMALGGAGIMLVLFPAYMLIFRNITSLGITSSSMYALATGIIYSLLITLIVFAVILLVLANLPYKKTKKSEE